jgi:hypothetical protein
VAFLIQKIEEAGPGASGGFEEMIEKTGTRGRGYYPGFLSDLSSVTIPKAYDYRALLF